MADKTLSLLPLSRVKTIMKSSPDVSSISQEALFTTGKATVMIFFSLLIFCSLVNILFHNNSDHGRRPCCTHVALLALFKLKLHYTQNKIQNRILCMFVVLHLKIVFKASTKV